MSERTAHRIGERINRTGLAPSLARLDEVVGEENLCREEKFTILARQLLSRLVADAVGPLNRVPGEMLVPAGSKPELIQNCRRES